MIVLLVLFVCSGAVISAQTPDADLRHEIEELKQGQAGIRQELQEIRSLLEKLATPQRPAGPVAKDVEFEIGDNPVKGNTAAKLILVEFTDYQCPFCGRFVKETLPQIRDQYIDRNLIRHVVIDQPLSMHPNAPKAAEMSHCAEEQGKFWEIHDLMMTNQDSLTDLSFYATALKLDLPEFEECVNGDRYAGKVRQDMELAQSLGINGVPGFVIGLVESENPVKIKGMSVIQGAMPFANFKKELDSALVAQ